VLRALAKQFPDPSPLDVLDGSSFCVHTRVTCEALSFLTDHEIGYGEQPSPTEVGEFVAAFHDCSAEISTDIGARPNGMPLRCHRTTRFRCCTFSSIGSARIASASAVRSY
jgi:hypothetical protein